MKCKVVIQKNEDMLTETTIREWDDSLADVSNGLQRPRLTSGSLPSINALALIFSAEPLTQPQIQQVIKERFNDKTGTANESVFNFNPSTSASKG